MSTFRQVGKDAAGDAAHRLGFPTPAGDKRPQSDRRRAVAFASVVADNRVREFLTPPGDRPFLVFGELPAGSNSAHFGGKDVANAPH